MSDQNSQAGEKPEISEEEAERNQQVIRDFIGLSQHIHPELRARLEEHLTPEARQAVLELQLLAIQYGRGIERAAMFRQLLEQCGPVPTKAAEAVRSTILATSSEQFKPTNPKDILVAPSHALTQMKRH